MSAIISHPSQVDCMVAPLRGNLSASQLYVKLQEILAAFEEMRREGVGFRSVLVNQNPSRPVVGVWTGTQAEYNALATPRPASILYVVIPD